MLQTNASQAGVPAGGSGVPDARNDADALAAGSAGPETGNVISGEGTLNGAAGADSVGNAPGLIVAIRGEGTEVAPASAGVMQVTGRYGTLTMNAQGDYSYVRNAGAPDGVEDVFNYTLADASGQRDTATLTISLGREPAAVEATQLVTTNDGVVVLPAGVELSDIRVVGRDLVITLPDGTAMTIPNGAVFVPRLVIGDVEVPAANLAALLIESEPQPAAGTPQSSGGNFAVDVPPLDPGVPLGDLLPPTELSFPQPTFEGVDQFIEDDEPPTVIIETPDNPAGAANATATINEAGLPARGSEPEGSNSGSNSEITSGTIVYATPDGFETVTINGVAVTVGTVITTGSGRLTITSIDNGSAGSIGYTYELLDNTSGNNTSDVFTVTVVDEDGDTATATLTVNIIDDVPTARADTDSIATGDTGTATGNVITDAAPGDSGDGDDGADTVGADDAAVTSISGAGGSDSTFADGVLQVTGEYGVLTIDAQGNYSYTRNADVPGAVTDTFNYTLMDGDGDTSTSTLTITIDDVAPATGENAAVLLDDDAIEGGNEGGTGDDTDSDNVTGTLAGSGGDGALSFDLLTTGAPQGFAYVDGPNGSVLVQQNGVTFLTITIDSATGQYSVTQDAPIDHPAVSDENNLTFAIDYVVSDQDGDLASGTITINVDDDTPTVQVSAGSDAEALLTTQDAETIGGASDTDSSDADFSGVFSVTAPAGADGSAGPSVSYTLNVANSVSGLTSHGEAINLYNVGGTVVGSTSASAPADLSDPSAVFSVSVSAAGVVTLTQYQQVDHPAEGPPGASDAPFDDQLAALAGGKITLTATASVTDGDDDTATGSETVDLGGNIRFADHGPSLQSVAAGAAVQLDETSALADGFPISADSDGAVVTAPETFGADGPAAAGSVEYGLALKGGVSSVSSGLQTAAGNHPITLTLVDSNTVEGRYTDGGTQVAFIIEMNADGSVTVTQNVALEHLLDGSSAAAHDDALDLNDLVEATVTIRDFDGDTASGSVAIGENITFRDDGPSIAVTMGADGGVLLRTQDADTTGSGSGSSSADLSGVFTLGSSAGSDGAASAPALAYTLGVASQGVNSGLTQGGSTISLYLIDGVVVGSTSATQNGVIASNTVFDVSVSSSGSVTLTQYSQIDHTNADPSATEAPFADHLIGLADNLITLTASATITDNDGDEATDSETVEIGSNLEFADDGPVARADTDGASEGASTSGNVLTGAGTTSGTAGADSAGADGFAASPNGAVIGIASVNESTSDTSANGAGNFVLAGAYGTLTLNRDGSYTYAADPDSNPTESDVFTYTVGDADGDTSTATLTINVSDVTLVADNDTVSVNEAALDTTITGNDVAAGTVTGSNPGSNAETATGTLTVAGATSFALNGSSSGSYGTLALNPNGTYAYTLTQPFDTSPDADNGTNTEPARDVFTYTAVDANGNSVQGTITVDIVDDVPIARADTDSVAEGSSTIGNVLTGAGTTGGAAGVDTAGADGFAPGGGVIGVAAGTDTSASVTTGVGTTITGTYGTLVLQASGGYTYTANPNSVTSAAVDHFVYTIQDGDGDRSTVTLDITVNPVNLTADNDVVAVNEAALDTTVTGNDVAAGTVTGSSPGSTAETATGALTVAGATSFALNGSGTGNYGTLVLNPNGTYAYTLTQPFDTSPTANNGTNTELGRDVFTYTATDANGNSVQGTISVNIVDDVPTATNDTIGQTTENSPITFSVFGNDVFGADGVDTDNNPAVAVTLTQPPAGLGAVTYNAATGQFTFTPATGQQASTSFTYTIIDGDGDRSTATVTVNLQADSTPQVVHVTAAVDDDALAGGNPGSADSTDLDANTGEPGATPSEAVYSGQVNVNFGGDAGTVSFANLHNTTGTVGAETVLYTWDAGTNTLTAAVNAGARAGTPLFTASLSPSGAYTVTLLDNVLHAAGGSENNATVVLNYRAADSDGDLNTTGSLTITFDDDTPTLGTIDDGSSNNDPAAPVTTGSLYFSVGADSPASVTDITFDTAGITSGGKGLVTNFAGGVLTAYQDANGNGTYEAGTDTSAVFTVTVNPTGGSTGQYTFNQIQPLDGDVIQVPIGGSSSFGAGPTQSQILTQTGDPTNELSVVSGWLTNNSTFNFAAWSGGAAANPLTLSSVNGSTAGWGVDDNNFEDDNDGTADFLRFDLSTVQDFDGAGPYTTPSITIPNAASATFDFINYNANDDLYVLVRFSNGSTAFSQVHITGNHTVVTYTAPAGLFIESVEMYADQTGPGKVSLVSVGTSSTTVDHDLDFTVVLSDADADTVQGSFTVNVANASSASSSSTMMASRQPDTEDSSSSLIASDTEEQQKATGGTNTTLLGAVAAAGLAGAPATAYASQTELSSATTDADLDLGTEAVTSSFVASDDDQSGTRFASETQQIAADETAISSSAKSTDAAVSSNDLAGADTSNQVAPTELLAPTDTPAQAPVTEATPLAQTVALPSAEALAAVSADDGEAQANHTQEVGRVINDALAGGENGPNIDALLEAATGDVQAPAVEAGATATHDAAAVPAWDIGDFAGFTGSHGTFSMESLMVHPDAPQAHAAS